MDKITLRKWVGPVVVALALLSLAFSGMGATASQKHDLTGTANGILLVAIGGYFCDWNESFGRAFVRAILLATACIASLAIAFVIAFVRESPFEMKRPNATV